MRTSVALEPSLLCSTVLTPASSSPPLHSLSRVAPIQVYLEKQFKDNAARTEEQLYQRSIELEPRESEAVRVARCVRPPSSAAPRLPMAPALTRLRPAL